MLAVALFAASSSSQTVPLPTVGAPTVALPCTGVTQAEHTKYATALFTDWRRPLLSSKSKDRLKRMRVSACTPAAAANMRRVERRLEQLRPRPPKGSLQHCVLSSESGFNPIASNKGSHNGIGQWSYPTWRNHVRLVYGRMALPADPRRATYRQQLHVFVNAFDALGCDDWCPYDPC